MEQAPSIRPKRRALRYSLRTLLALVALLALVLGNRASRFVREQQAVSAIVARGGIVIYFDDRYGRIPPHQGMIGWLREYWGLRWPGEVYLKGKEITDDVLLDTVLLLRDVRSIDLSETSVTSKGLAQLAPLKSLSAVTIHSDRRHDRLAAELGEPTMIDIVEVPLQDCVDYLIDLHRIPIEIDKPALAAAHLGPDSPITGTMKNKNLATALDTLLAPHGMGWIVAGGKLVITTRGERVKHDKAVAAVNATLPQVKQLTID